VLYLGRQLVDSRIAGGELIECFPEREPVLEILRALPVGPGKSEVRDRGQRPRRIDQCASPGEEG
jgi:hypothetical protein